MLLTGLIACTGPTTETGTHISTLDNLSKQEMADEVKEAFLHAWNGYKQFAWGHDALKPLSRSYHDWYAHSLLMTPVDAFDTMILMELQEEAGEAKNLIMDSLSFNYDMDVQVFEVTIRLLGGLIAAYQLDGDPRFLELATDLADRLLPAFNTPTGMPFRYINLITGITRDSINNPAEIGTLTVEFGTLSKLTGNPVYYDKAKQAVMALFERRSDIGLVGTTINVMTGEWINQQSHISAMIDSYYEYHLKASKLFNDKDFQDMFDAGMKAVNKYLADTTFGGLWYGQANMFTGARTGTRFGALDAFMPGLLVLSGDITRAIELQENCFRMWTKHGIEPETIDYSNFEILWPSYVLRPENIESATYLYHKTGDEKYLEMGKVMFQSILQHCKTDAGFAAIRDVRTMEKSDQMESFFLAETLKYAYLLFAEIPGFDFNKKIFNTEAHLIGSYEL